jgi:formiminoglutamate deiminase
VSVTQVWCELAVVDGRPQPGVLIDMVDGRFASVVVGAEPGDATRLAGCTVPGLANAHSHAFHRALRSRTQANSGTFWTWRDLMYQAAAGLCPDTYHRLARAVFAEMAMAGASCVGEFHYVHHQPDGTPYADPNAMGEALLAAATEAGIRITLLDTLYLHGGLSVDGYAKLSGTQRRFGDGTVDVWIDRVDKLAPSDTQRVGAAIHSVRAVDPRSVRRAGEWTSTRQAPLHAHVSEQVAENEACLAYHRGTPMQLLADAGALGDRFSAVHATHLSDDDVELLVASGSTVVMCPTTERDLGDGIGPTGRFAQSGVAMALGSDSHAVIDLFEEARAVELDERLSSRSRGIHAAPVLLEMATVNGHRSLGWDDAGTITVGNRADLVTVALDSVRTAGVVPGLAIEATMFAATASDITDVYVDGRRIVAEGRHFAIDVAAELDATIKELMDHV